MLLKILVDGPPETEIVAYSRSEQEMIEKAFVLQFEAIVQSNPLTEPLLHERIEDNKHLVDGIINGACPSYRPGDFDALCEIRDGLSNQKVYYEVLEL